MRTKLPDKHSKRTARFLHRMYLIFKGTTISVDKLSDRDSRRVQLLRKVGAI